MNTLRQNRQLDIRTDQAPGMAACCSICQGAFEISARDQSFYQQLSKTLAVPGEGIPVPSRCPACRRRQRIAFRNERTFYRRMCDGSGENLVSIHPEGGAKTVYSRDYWWSDNWDPLAYGRDFDFSKPFFPQYQALFAEVPMLAVMNDARSENVAYSPFLIESRNCYLCIGGAFLNDCSFCTFTQRSMDCLDCCYSRDLELCYECVSCEHCYNVSFSQNCLGCSDSALLFNCRNLKNCFGCAGLSNKEYHLFNEPLSKEEYQRHVREIRGSHSAMARAKQRFAQLRNDSPKRSYEGSRNEDVTGDHLHQSKGSYHCYDSREIEECSYVTNALRGNAVLDVDFGADCELCLEGVALFRGYANLSVLFCPESRFTQYSTFCMSSEYLFACAGLRNKRYCIFNKQYTKDEYHTLVTKIISHMQETGEYGEFFPPELSPHSYRDTLAHEFFPLEKNEAIAMGFNWSESSVNNSEHSATEPVELPDNITDVTDDILEKPIRCEVSNKMFKITAKELRYYRINKMPIPRLHPDERHKSRIALRNPRHLQERSCAGCDAFLLSPTDPNTVDAVYCEQCFSGL